MDTWFTTTWTTALLVVLSTLCVYAAVLVLTRLAGLRSFSKLSSFDFAITIAIGAVIASTLVSQKPALLQGAVALASLYGVQIAVAVARRRSAFVRGLVNNDPLLLMNGSEVLNENLRKAHMTRGDLHAKLREANVLDPGEVRAVVMETTGDVTVLHGDPDGTALHPVLLDGVRDAQRFVQRDD